MALGGTGEYPAEDDHSHTEMFSNGCFRDSLPEDLYQLESAVVDGDVHPVRKCPETGANVNAFLDPNHLKALMLAGTTGDWDVSRVFVEDFDADLDGPVSRAGTRAINYAGYQGHCFPVGHPICEYLKSEGSQHACRR